MEGQIISVTAVNTDLVHHTIVIETDADMSLEEIDEITYVNSRRIPTRGGEPAIRPEHWGVVPIDEFTAKQSYLKRSPKGKLSVLAPINSHLRNSKVSDVVFYSKD